MLARASTKTFVSRKIL